MRIFVFLILVFLVLIVFYVVLSHSHTTFDNQPKLFSVGCLTPSFAKSLVFKFLRARRPFQKLMDY